MLCEKCINKKTRIQDGGRKVRCQALSIDIGFAQSIDDPAFPMRFYAKITECDCFEREKDISQKLESVMREIIPKIKLLDEKENNHPFGG